MEGHTWRYIDSLMRSRHRLDFQVFLDHLPSGLGGVTGLLGKGGGGEENV